MTIETTQGLNPSRPTNHSITFVETEKWIPPICSALQFGCPLNFCYDAGITRRMHFWWFVDASCWLSLRCLRSVVSFKRQTMRVRLTDSSSSSSIGFSRLMDSEDVKTWSRGRSFFRRHHSHSFCFAVVLFAISVVGYTHVVHHQALAAASSSPSVSSVNIDTLLDLQFRGRQVFCSRCGEDDQSIMLMANSSLANQWFVVKVCFSRRRVG